MGFAVAPRLLPSVLCSSSFFLPEVILMEWKGKGEGVEFDEMLCLVDVGKVMEFYFFGIMERYEF